VEVSKETPTLTIEDKPETTTRKATIEEVPDEEAPTLVADRQPISDAIIEEIPPLVIDSEDSDEEPLNVATLESEDEMIIAYIKGEPVIGIFEKKDTLFTGDHDYPKYDYTRIAQEFDGSVHQSDQNGTLLDKTRGSELKCLFLNNLLMTKLIPIRKRRNH
jgi:hypothetical protein